MFLFKVKKKRLYPKGVLVIGEIQHGELFYDEDVIVHIGLDYYDAHIDAINNNYPHGDIVYACSRGKNVGIFLSNIDYHTIVLGKTMIEGEPCIEKPIMTHTSNNKARKEKVKKVIENIPHSAQTSERVKEERIKYPTSHKEQSHIIHSIVQEDATSEKTTCALQYKTNIENSIESNRKAQLPTSPLKNITSEEKEFISDIKHCLKDGGRISPTEFYILDKIRASLLIKKSRAKELISITVNDYSLKQNEIEYRDAVSLCLMDSNFITSTERFLLNRLRISLHIDQAKAYDIERNCQWILRIEEEKR